MEPRIELLSEKKLIGKHLSMSLSDNKTTELWKRFMIERKEIKNNLTADLISMQVYNQLSDFNNIDQNRIFEKWAAVEVLDFDTIPDGMEAFRLEGGLYAVFLYKGPADKGFEIFRFIFGIWLPNSIYHLDDRPHFEKLGEKYKNNDSDSEEEIWLPIKPK